MSKDKQLHLLAGFMVSLVVTLLLNPIIALITVAAVSAIKEYYDSKHPDTPTVDPWDFLFSVIGAVLAVLAVGLFYVFM